MIELAQYLVGGTALVAICLVALAQLIWQGYRIYSAPPMIKPVAFGIIFASITAVAPPHEYTDLERMMIATLIVIPLCIVTLIADPGYWRLLSLAYIIIACLTFSGLIQAAR